MNKFLLTFKDKDFNDLKEFAEKAEATRKGVIVYSGKHYFDGGSLMSLIAIKNRDSVMVVYGKEEKDFENFLVEKYLEPYCPKYNNYMENI